VESAAWAHTRRTFPRGERANERLRRWSGCVERADARDKPRPRAGVGQLRPRLRPRAARDGSVDTRPRRTGAARAAHAEWPLGHLGRGGSSHAGSAPRAGPPRTVLDPRRPRLVLVRSPGCDRADRARVVRCLLRPQAGRGYAQAGGGVPRVLPRHPGRSTAHRPARPTGARDVRGAGAQALARITLVRVSSQQRRSPGRFARRRDGILPHCPSVSGGDRFEAPGLSRPTCWGCAPCSSVRGSRRAWSTSQAL